MGESRGNIGFLSKNMQDKRDLEGGIKVQHRTSRLCEVFASCKTVNIHKSKQTSHAKFLVCKYKEQQWHRHASMHWLASKVLEWVLIIFWRLS